MPERPRRQELSPQEAARLKAAYKKVKTSQQAAAKDRRLIQAVAEIDKPAAVARELGVDVSTIAYWIRTPDDRS